MGGNLGSAESTEIKTLTEITLHRQQRQSHIGVKEKVILEIFTNFNRKHAWWCPSFSMFSETFHSLLLYLHTIIFTAYLTLPVPILDKAKINLNFYSHISLWCRKRFYEGIKGLHQTF